MMADCFAANFHLVFDVKSNSRVGDITIGLVQIPRATLSNTMSSAIMDCRKNQ